MNSGILLPPFPLNLPPPTFITSATTLAPNSLNIINGTTNFNVTLPANPLPGSTCLVFDRVTTVNRHYLVIPSGGATVDGATTGVNLRLWGDYCFLIFDGTNWEIISYQASGLTAPMGNGAQTGSNLLSLGQQMTLQRGGSVSASAAPAVPLLLSTGLTGVDISCGPFFFSGGTVTVTLLNVALCNPAVTNKLVMRLNTSFAMTSGVAASPGVGGMPALNTASWTQVESIGTDLSIHSDGSSFDSAAGGQYFYMGQAQITTSQLVP